MPANPHLERFNLDEDGVAHDVVAIAHHELQGHELVLVVPEASFDDGADDMDAWVRAVVVDALGARSLDDVPDALVDAAWEVFDTTLSLQTTGDAE